MYIYSYNNRLLGQGNPPIYNSIAALYAHKNFLVSAGWTVKGSGTYNSLLNIDQVSTTSDLFTGPQEGSNGMGNDISWFVIEDPAGIKQFLFLKNRNLYISELFLLGGFQVIANVQQPPATNINIICPETYTQPDPTIPPIIGPAPVFLYNVYNDFQFDGYACFNGFKWFDDSDRDVLIDGTVNGVDTPVYVSIPPSYHSNYIADDCGTHYRVYDGYILKNNAATIGGGFIEGTHGVLGAPGSAAGKVIIEGRIVGGISGFHINSGFQIVNGVRTAVSNIDIDPYEMCLDESFVDTGRINQPISNVIFAKTWFGFEQCFKSNYTVDIDHCHINLSPQAYTLTKPVKYGLLPFCSHEFSIININLPDGCILNLSSGAYPVGTLTDIAGTDNSGTYVPGYIQEFTGDLIVDGYIITDGYVLRDIKYVYDGWYDDAKKIYIADGYVGNGNITYATSSQSNRFYQVAYSASSKFDMSAPGFYNKPVASINPPIANDMVWLHKKDNYVGVGLRADANGYYYPNNTRILPSITHPGLPDPYYDEADFTSAQPTDYFPGLAEYDISNYHMAANTSAPYQWYFLVTYKNSLLSLLAFDTVTGGNTNNSDKSVIINQSTNSNHFGAHHHSKYIKSWYGDTTTISSRTDLETALTNNTCRFMESNIANISFYQTSVEYAGLDGIDPGASIAVSGNYTISTDTNIVVTAAGSTDKVILPTSPYFGQEVTVTNAISGQSITVHSGATIAGAVDVVLPMYKTANFTFTGSLWIMDVFSSYLIDLNKPLVPIATDKDLSAVAKEYLITVSSPNQYAILPVSALYGDLININNVSTYYPALINGQIKINGIVTTQYKMHYKENLALVYDGAYWVNTTYDGIQLAPTIIDLSAGSYSLLGGGTRSKQYAAIAGPSTNVPQSAFGKVYLSRQPQDGELVTVTNYSTSYKNVYGINQINGLDTGFQIDGSNGISIAPNQTILFRFCLQTRAWSYNKFAIAVPSNLSNGILATSETMLPVFYVKTELPGITNPELDIQNQYKGISSLFYQDTVKRLDLEMLDINFTSFFVTVNLNKDNNSNPGTDSGTTLILPWVDSTAINAD